LSRLGALASFLLIFVVLVPFLVHNGGPSLELGSLRISVFVESTQIDSRLWFQICSHIN